MVKLSHRNPETRILGKTTLEDEFIHFAGDVRPLITDRLGHSTSNGGSDAAIGDPLKWLPPCQETVEQNTHAPHIRFGQVLPN